MTGAYSLEILLTLLILVFYWFMPELMPASLPFGVRIPPERQGEPTIARVRRAYRLGLLLIALGDIVGAALLVLTLPTFPIAPSVVLFSALTTTIDYYVAHRRLALVKARERWYAGQRQVLVADTSAPRRPLRLFPFWLGLNVLLLVAMFAGSILRYPVLPARLPIHFNANGMPNAWAPKLPGLFMVPLTALLLTALLFAMAYYLPKYSRQQVDPTDPATSRARQQRLRSLLINIMLATVTLANGISLLASLVVWQIIPAGSSLLVSSNLLPLLLVFAMIMILVLNFRRVAAARGSSRKAGYVQRDDDRYWLAGIFYFNREDPSLFVEKRFGLGWTLNLGHPFGLVALALLIGLPLGIALLSTALGAHH